VSNFSRLVRFFVVIVPVWITVFTAIATAQTNGSSDLRYWDNRLTAIEKRLETGGIDDLETRKLRSELERIIESAAAIRSRFAERVRQIGDQVSALKPKSGADGAPESDEVKAKLIDLERELASFQGQARQSELIITRSNQIISKMSRNSSERLKQTLFERGVSPLNFGVWKSAGAEILELTGTSISKYFEIY